MTENIHERILLARRRAGLTQQQAADLASVSLSTWRSWEAKASPRGEVVPRIARALGVSPNELYGWNDPQEQP